MGEPRVASRMLTLHLKSPDEAALNMAPLPRSLGNMATPLLGEDPGGVDCPSTQVPHDQIFSLGLSLSLARLFHLMSLQSTFKM